MSWRPHGSTRADASGEMGAERSDVHFASLFLPAGKKGRNRQMPIAAAKCIRYFRKAKMLNAPTEIRTPIKGFGSPHSIH